MSLLATKMIAINIVDLQDGQRPIADVSLTNAGVNTSDRIAELEAQVKQLKQWKTSFTPEANLKTIYSSSSASTSAPNSPQSLRSFDSLDPSDVPQLETSLVKPVEAKKSNMPSKKPKRDTDLASKILSIIQGFGHNEANSEGDDWLGRAKFDARVRGRIETNDPIDLVLPAFPWKSVNKVEKVIGAVPDLGEEMGLGRLQHLCEDIGEIYPPGAYVTITSDGLVYNDLLGIPDEEVFGYGGALRQMAIDKGYDRLKFIRIMNLLGLTDSPHMTKEDYLSSTTDARKKLETYIPEGFSCYDAILTDQDINLTYCGYMQFLAKDMKFSPITAGVATRAEYRRVVKRVAQDMITRGKGFAALIEAKLPDYVRLSIHRSTGENKLSFPLVPQPNHFSMTPWHCSILVTSKGQFRTAHAHEIRETADLIEQEGRPYYFRDKSDVWKWDVPVDFEFFYPKGVYVKAKRAEGEEAPKLGSNDLRKLKELSKGFSAVIPTGFA